MLHNLLLPNSKNTLSTINTKSLPSLELHTLYPQFLPVPFSGFHVNCRLHHMLPQWQ
jgi:hypothetical protein